jgi:hypothetical protein
MGVKQVKLGAEAVGEPGAGVDDRVARRIERSPDEDGLLVSGHVSLLTAVLTACILGWVGRGRRYPFG